MEKIGEFNINLSWRNQYAGIFFALKTKGLHTTL